MLQTTNLASGYETTQVLSDIDISVDEQEIVGIIGRNGAGKTTLIKTIIGLLAPSGGTIHFKGDDITEMPANKRARAGMGYIPQGRDVFPNLTVEQNLKMGELVNKNSEEKLYSLVYEYFPRLDERRKQKAGTMSGGEQQMLAIGRALVGNPDILLLDEPSEGIQPSIVKEIGENIVDINESLGTSILLVEQNLEFIQSTINRGYVIDNGRLTGKLTPEDVDDDETLRNHLSI